MTYGYPTNLTFKPVTFVDKNGKVVPGRLGWNRDVTIWEANTRPDGTEIPGANKTEAWRFYPDDSVSYEGASGWVEVIVYPAKPTVAQAPVIPDLERRESPLHGRTNN